MPTAAATATRGSERRPELDVLRGLAALSVLGFHLWRFLVFGQNFGSDTVMKLNPPTWTLVVEASFYLVLPAFGAVALRLGSRRWAQAVVPLALVAAGLGFNLWLARHAGLPPT